MKCMMYKIYLKLICLLLPVIYTHGYSEEGEKCSSNGQEGVCLNIRRCQSAIDDIKNQRKTPQLCSFSNAVPIVCCFDNAKPTTTPLPVATTSTARPASTTQYVPEEYDYEINGGVPAPKDQCEPLAANLTSKPTGQKAWDKCLEYQEKLVYPCHKSVALTGQKARSNWCKHDAKQLIVGGVGATKDEFPHMVLMGYGKDMETVQWLCGGTLISARFVLTAGHCTSSRDFGPITYVRLSALNRTEPLDLEKVYRVKNIIKHPMYRSPHRYHDIALVETDREMTLDQFSVPACLDTSAPNDYDSALATGWGATANRGATADQLQKVILKKFKTPECSNMFPSHRLMKSGFDEQTQICYGDKNESKDTCQGDSGGPLQLKHHQIICMYTVIGVTSFGRACGVRGEPGIYTRVANYVPWIESIVWP